MERSFDETYTVESILADVLAISEKLQNDAPKLSDDLLQAAGAAVNLLFNVVFYETAIEPSSARILKELLGTADLEASLDND